ncbi:MAG TPA: presqualene diphosphate synthase HpnD [Gammaproteobacteria bacterium]|nr:presqualene diphosphate synthase HpnD [Gammaproteobacteria bacterium]
MTSAQEYCQNKAAASGSSFYYSFLFLPPEQRAAITAVYAFCREIDDVVDECSDTTVASTKLKWWASEIDRVFLGQPQHPVGVALHQALQKFPLQRIWFDQIMQGMTMDLHYQGYQTYEDLNLYCHCVASTVGMLAATIFGYKNPSTLEYAKQLGMAFQMINIVRDIGEDARRGRIYIPEEELAAFGISPADILQAKNSKSDKLHALLAKQAQLARDYYASALSLLAPEDRASQRSGLIMAKIYFTILSEIERANFAVLKHKISITPIRKLWIAWRSWHAEKKLCHQL